MSICIQCIPNTYHNTPKYVSFSQKSLCWTKLLYIPLHTRYMPKIPIQTIMHIRYIPISDLFSMLIVPQGNILAFVVERIGKNVWRIWHSNEIIPVNSCKYTNTYKHVPDVLHMTIHTNIDWYLWIHVIHAIHSNMYQNKSVFTKYKLKQTHTDNTYKCIQCVSLCTMLSYAGQYTKYQNIP